MILLGAGGSEVRGLFAVECLHWVHGRGSAGWNILAVMAGPASIHFPDDAVRSKRFGDARLGSEIGWCEIYWTAVLDGVL